jgi:hypothetical protein
LAVGAHHLEPTKFLQDEDWALILGRVVRLPTPPRESLKLLAEDATVLAGPGRFKLSRIHSIEFHAKAQRRKGKTGLEAPGCRSLNGDRNLSRSTPFMSLRLCVKSAASD